MKEGPILLLVGARFLGHAYPLGALAKALKQLTNLPINCCMIPLASGSDIPAAEYLSRHVTNLKVYTELQYNINRSSPIRDYADLIRAIGLDQAERVEKYSSVLRRIIDLHNPSLVITDSLPVVPQISAILGIPVIAMRSHALKQRIDLGVQRDVFLDSPIEKKDIDDNAILVKKLTAAFGLTATDISIDDLFYSCPTVTPGFDGFDVCSGSAQGHIFMRLGTLNNRNLRKSSKKALVYIRDPKLRGFVADCLLKQGFILLELDDFAESGVDFWSKEVDASIIISHGGHGMACAALYQQIPHIAVADTDDRYTIGCRIEAAQAGFVLDARNNNLPKREEFISKLKSLPDMTDCRKQLNFSSNTPEEVAEWCLLTACNENS